MFSKEELTILSEEEVFGWTEEEQVILNVLMKAEVQGNFRGNRLSVFDKAENIRTPITDLVKLTGGNFSYEDKNLAEFVYTKSCDKKGNVRTFGNNGGRWSAISSDAQGTIRPVLRSNEVYLDLLNLPHSEDFEEVEYGEYPQYAASIEMQDVLENV